MITEAIILAGGLGTRLQSAVPQLPKCMAPVAGKPFIDYVISYLQGQGITHFILALGYRSEAIQQHFQQQFAHLDISISLEDEPLGTGGAIAKAAKLVRSKYVLATNGDTLYEVKIPTLPLLENGTAECILFLKPMQNVDRYGKVEAGENGLILNFQEKQFFAEGQINGGLYALNVPAFLQQPFPTKFSFEKDYLEAGVERRKFYGVPSDAYFIDIGIPEDYERAGRELAGK
jgi:D-glycero-alpha-D-manno-heptose 1-phosphate guanylyltransferase